MAKEYSCVKKTKKAFENSLALLAKEHQLNKITVKEICEVAQLSRNAFYFHYKDINDLITDIEDNVVSEVAAILEDIENLGFPRVVYATIDKFIDLFEARRDTVLMLMDKSFSTSFTVRMSQMFSEFNYKFFREFNGDRAKVSYEFFYIYLSGGFYDVVRYWLDHQDKMSKDSLKALCYVLIKRLIVPVDPDIDSLVSPNKKD